MRKDKLIAKLRQQPHNTRFDDFVAAVERCGFVYARTTGSHRFYYHPSHPELQLNLQPVAGKAKAYQVRDFLAKVDRYNLADG